MYNTTRIHIAENTHNSILYHQYQPPEIGVHEAIVRFVGDREGNTTEGPPLRAGSGTSSRDHGIP